MSSVSQPPTLLTIAPIVMYTLIMAYLIQAPLSVFYNVLGIQPGVILSAVGDICCLSLKDEEGSSVEPMRRRLEAPRVETYEQGAALTRVRGRSVSVEEKIWQSRSADRPSRTTAREKEDASKSVQSKTTASTRRRKPELAAAAWTKHSLGAVVESDEYEEEDDSSGSPSEQLTTIDKESISSPTFAPSLERPLSSSLPDDKSTPSSKSSKSRSPRFKLRSLTLPSTRSHSRSPLPSDQISPPSSPTTTAAVHVSFSTPLSTMSTTSSSNALAESRSDSSSTSSTGSQDSLPRRLRTRTRSLSSALKSRLVSSPSSPQNQKNALPDFDLGSTTINTKLTLLGKRARPSSCASERSGLMRLVRREAIVRSKFAVSI